MTPREIAEQIVDAIQSATGLAALTKIRSGKREDAVCAVIPLLEEHGVNEEGGCADCEAAAQENGGLEAAIANALDKLQGAVQLLEEA